jgi:hypothetical protein
VSLQSVNVAIHMNTLYRTAARHIQTFVLWIAERGNWLSVRVADAAVRTRNTAGSRTSNSYTYIGSNSPLLVVILGRQQLI